jgi:hypothetical protein
LTPATTGDAILFAEDVVREMSRSMSTTRKHACCSSRRRYQVTEMSAESIMEKLETDKREAVWPCTGKHQLEV